MESNVTNCILSQHAPILVSSYTITLVYVYECIRGMQVCMYMYVYVDVCVRTSMLVCMCMRSVCVYIYEFMYNAWMCM